MNTINIINENKEYPATEIISVMSRMRMGQLPPRALGYLRVLGDKYGICGEVSITALAHYVQNEHGLSEPNGSLYKMDSEFKKLYQANEKIIAETATGFSILNRIYAILNTEQRMEQFDIEIKKAKNKWVRQTLISNKISCIADKDRKLELINAELKKARQAKRPDYQWLHCLQEIGIRAK